MQELDREVGRFLSRTSREPGSDPASHVFEGRERLSVAMQRLRALLDLLVRGREVPSGLLLETRRQGLGGRTIDTTQSRVRTSKGMRPV